MKGVHFVDINRVRMYGALGKMVQLYPFFSIKDEEG
jgi:hypothetical protein